MSKGIEWLENNFMETITFADYVAEDISSSNYMDYIYHLIDDSYRDHLEVSEMFDDEPMTYNNFVAQEIETYFKEEIIKDT